LIYLPKIVVLHYQIGDIPLYTQYIPMIGCLSPRFHHKSLPHAVSAAVDWQVGSTGDATGRMEKFTELVRFLPPFFVVQKWADPKMGSINGGTGMYWWYWPHFLDG